MQRSLLLLLNLLLLLLLFEAYTPQTFYHYQRFTVLSGMIIVGFFPGQKKRRLLLLVLDISPKLSPKLFGPAANLSRHWSLHWHKSPSYLAFLYLSTAPNCSFSHLISFVWIEVKSVSSVFFSSHSKRSFKTCFCWMFYNAKLFIRINFTRRRRKRRPLSSSLLSSSSTRIIMRRKRRSRRRRRSKRRRKSRRKSRRERIEIISNKKLAACDGYSLYFSRTSTFFLYFTYRLHDWMSYDESRCTDSS